MYFDYAATTPLDPIVKDHMVDIIHQQYGNPSSLHRYGREARKIIDDAREMISRYFDVSSEQVIFTSSATEATNLAIKSSLFYNKQKGRHIITSNVEHSSVKNLLNELEEHEGYEVTRLPVDENGLIQAEQVRNALRDDTVLVTMMFVNNETGVMLPVYEVGELLVDHQAFFHVDAVQAVGRMTFTLDDLCADYMSISAHKLYGPKGIGALLKRLEAPIKPLIYGGSHELERRAGTENVIHISAFGKAIERLAEQSNERNIHCLQLKELFINTLQQLEVPFAVNGSMNSVAHILNIYLPFKTSEILLTQLDLKDVHISAGSACTAGALQPSHVLMAMYGESSERVTHSIRISLSHMTTEDEVIAFANILKDIYNNSL